MGRRRTRMAASPPPTNAVNIDRPHLVVFARSENLLMRDGFLARGFPLLELRSQLSICLNAELQTNPSALRGGCPNANAH